MWTIILVGLFNSIMFPSIFTLGIAGLGPLTGKAPACWSGHPRRRDHPRTSKASLADHIGIHHSFIIPAIRYLYIAFFAFRSNMPHAEASGCLTIRD